MRVPLLLAATAMLSVSLAAQADTFSFSFGTSADPFSGSGFFTGDLVAPDEYLISGVTGTTDTGDGVNRNIAALLDPGTFPTLENGGTEPPNDNLLAVVGDTGFLDAAGVSYILGNGAQINLFNEGSGNDALLERSTGVTVFEDVPITITAVTPEPSTFVLLGTGLLGAVGAMRRRLA